MAGQVIGVTGATGGLGGRVAQRLARDGIGQRLIVRDPARAPRLEGAEVVEAAGYADTDAMRRAFEGVDVLLLVSAADEEDRPRLHRNAIEAAAAAGVRQLVYTSFVGASPAATFTLARHHAQTEADIRATGIEHTFIRSSLYVDFLPLLCGADGVIRGPADGGRFAPVARDDVADTIVVVLTGHGHEGQTYDLTGPELITMEDAAAELSRVTRRQIRFEDETVEEAWASRRPSGAPDWMIEGWISTYTAIAEGEIALVTEVVEQLTGHEPRRVGDWLRENRESWRHLLHTS